MEVSLSCEILKQVQDDFKFSSSRQQNSFGRKRAEQWWPVRLQGHSKFLLKRRVDANEVGQNNCSPWFCLICGAKAMCGKEAFLMTSPLVTLWLQSKGPPAAKSGYTLYLKNKKILRSTQQ